MTMAHQFISLTQVANGVGRLGVLYTLDVPPFTNYMWTGAAFAPCPRLEGGALTADGVIALTEVVEHGPEVTATGVAYTGNGYFAGINVPEMAGGVQTIVVREGTTVSGRIIKTYNIDEPGQFAFMCTGARVKFSNGLYFSFSGGTSRTAYALVEPA
jgi:hypothetical protein